MQTFWDNVLRVVAVIGLLAVLLLGAWGIIQIAFLLPSFFGGLFGSRPSTTIAGETVSVSVPATATANTPFTLTWSHTKKSGEYSYAVSYSCESNFAVAALTPTGSWSQVPCNTPFNYTNASSSMSIIGLLGTSTKSAKPTFTVTATKLSTGAITARGTAATTVNAPTSTATKPTTTTKPKTTTKSGGTYYASGRTSNLYGYPDLAVTIDSVQSIGGNAAVIFTIKNVGTNVSPANWTFNATIPQNGTYVYPSAPQQALYPGDRIVYTLRYSETSGYNGNQPCTGYGFPCAAPTTYGGPGSCNQYGPCTVPGYVNYTVTPNQYSYSYSGSWNNQQVVSIQVDPSGYFNEVTKANNWASQYYVAY